MNKIYLKDNRGFTLIEMLLVLLIVGIVSSIVCYVTLSISEKKNIDQFFTQVIFDIQSMQALAMEEEKTIFINFALGDRYYAYYELNGEKIFTKSFPEGVKLNTYSNLKTIAFGSNGNVVKFGTMIFNTSYGERQLIVYIQEGRLKLVE